MCSRFIIDSPWDVIAKLFDLENIPGDVVSGEIRPTNKALIIDSSGAARGLHWGIPAPWDGKPLINARSETLTQKQTFRPLLENRCLVPADAYFEWRKDGKQRLKNRISLKNGEVIGFAGLISGEHFTILTCEPSPSIAHIHNRMPVILPKTAKNEWCDSSKFFGDVRQWLKPCDASALIAKEDTPPEPPQADLFN